MAIIKERCTGHCSNGDSTISIDPEETAFSRQKYISRKSIMDPRRREAVSRLEVMLSSQDEPPQKDSPSWEEAIVQAKAVTGDLDATPNARNSLGIPRWVNLIGLLQKLAYVDPDSGAQPEIATWCEQQWADVLQNHPHNVPALQGLGHASLLKCQRVLAQIYQDESVVPSQGTADSPRSRAVRPLIQKGGQISYAEAQMINSLNFVEARSLLRPALESFDRAVEAADLQGAMSGALLELAAEAYMSFGNVSHPRNNEICYQKSLKFLQRASMIEGYIMDPYLSTYLQQNIQFIH